jgi:hypothetical protein
MNERKVAIVMGGLAAKGAEVCWHACGIGNQGRLRRHGAHMGPGAVKRLGRMGDVTRAARL